MLSLVTLFFSATASSDPLILQPTSELLIEGTSNVHAYTSRARSLKTHVEVGRESTDAPALERAFEKRLGHHRLKTFELSVPVSNLSSGKPALDKKMYQALKADVAPIIFFQLRRLTVTDGDPAAGTFLLTAEGDLTVAGQTKPIELHAECVFQYSAIVIRGTKKLLMSDFGITPPSAMLGLLKTDDAVTIHFSFELQPTS